MPSKLYKWNDIDRWQDFDPTLLIDTGETKLNKLILKSRLIVFSYDSTGLLETLSQNIPSIAFWENGLDHLFEDVVPYYKLLVEVGIIHLDVNSITNHINNNWDNIDDWWFNNKTQSAINTFCEKYSKTTKSPIKDIQSVFKDAN